MLVYIVKVGTSIRFLQNMEGNLKVASYMHTRGIAPTMDIQVCNQVDLYNNFEGTVNKTKASLFVSLFFYGI